MWVRFGNLKGKIEVDGTRGRWRGSWGRVSTLVDRTYTRKFSNPVKLLLTNLQSVQVYRSAEFGISIPRVGSQTVLETV